MHEIDNLSVYEDEQSTYRQDECVVHVRSTEEK